MNTKINDNVFLRGFDMARKRQNDAAAGGGANWMDSYCDMVTLLMCFFILLYAFSSIDDEKWLFLVGAFSGAPVEVVPVMDFYSASVPAIQPIGYRSEDIDMDEYYAAMNELAELAEAQNMDMSMFEALLAAISGFIDDNNLQNSASIMPHPETRTIILRFADNVLFESGSATILPIFRHTMDQVIVMLDTYMDMIGMIRIEGHTDNIPIRTAQFEDNWDLSGKRATNVLRYFIDSGLIDTEKISVTSYGEFRPIEANDTVDGRAANRRVDFVIESISVRQNPQPFHYDE